MILKIIVRLIVLPFFAGVIIIGSAVSCCRIIYNFLRYGGHALANPKPQQP